MTEVRPCYYGFGEQLQLVSFSNDASMLVKQQVMSLYGKHTPARLQYYENFL